MLIEFNQPYDITFFEKNGGMYVGLSIQTQQLKDMIETQLNKKQCIELIVMLSKHLQDNT